MTLAINDTALDFEAQTTEGKQRQQNSEHAVRSSDGTFWSARQGGKDGT